MSMCRGPRPRLRPPSLPAVQATLFCSLCNVVATSQKNFDAHLRGFKHHKRVKLHEFTSAQRAGESGLLAVTSMPARCFNHVICFCLFAVCHMNHLLGIRSFCSSGVAGSWLGCTPDRRCSS